MKKSDFIKENIVLQANNMQRDHEVQMAREECYHIASNAIALHKLLKTVSESHGLDGWVSEKISLANDYVNTGKEYLEYELQTGSPSSIATLGEDGGMTAGATTASSIAAAPPRSLFPKKVIKRKMK